MATARGGDGFILLRMTEMIPVATGADQDEVTQIKEQLASAFQRDLVNAFSQTLQDSHGVTINQPLIEELITGVPRY